MGTQMGLIFAGERLVSFLRCHDSRNVISHSAKSPYSCIKLLVRRVACGPGSKYNHLTQTGHERSSSKNLFQSCLLRRETKPTLAATFQGLIWREYGI